MFLLLAFVFGLVLQKIKGSTVSPKATLEQVHVIFRHGQRTPSSTPYPTDPHFKQTYYPMGLGQLTLEGKSQEYQIGKNLRKNYNAFLGPVYTDDLLEARSSDTARTKMSLQLVLAGLWPPCFVQKWSSELNWQPIPYLYDTAKRDQILTVCYNYPKYMQRYKALLNSPEVQLQMKEYQPIFDYINQHSGLNTRNPLDLMTLYFYLLTQEDFGLQLPEWTKQVYPDVLREFTIMDYLLKISTRELLQTAIGGLMQKIRTDIQDKMLGSKSKKMYLYSGHEFTIVFALEVLNAFAQNSHVPGYGSYITIELHQVQKKYGVKIFYNSYRDEIPMPITIPGCDAFCPIEDFFKTIAPFSENIVTDC